MMLRIDIIESIRKSVAATPPTISDLNRLTADYADACHEYDVWLEKGVRLLDSEFPIDLFRILFRLYFQLEFLKSKP